MPISLISLVLAFDFKPLDPSVHAIGRGGAEIAFRVDDIHRGPQSFSSNSFVERIQEPLKSGLSDKSCSAFQSWVSTFLVHS